MYKITCGCDHAGYNLEKQIIKYLQDHDNFVTDKGCFSLDSVDYPDFAFAVAKDVANGFVNFGILVCKTGIGMSIAANKVRGARAALVSTVDNAILARQHNDANILCLSAKDLTYDEVIKIVDAFIKTPFSEGRHAIRINKITTWENQNL